MRILILHILLLTVNGAFGQVVVNDLKIENLRRTKASYINQWLTIQQGDTTSIEEIEENVQILKDLNLFFDVNYRIDSMDNKRVVCFIIDEAHYVYPSFQNIGSSENFNFSIGVTDINFLGKGQRLGFLYRYYDRHSFKVFHLVPVHRNNKTGHSIVAGKYSSVEPLYFESSVQEFNFDSYSLSLGGTYWLNRKWSVKLGGMYLYENYKNVSGDAVFEGEVFEMGNEFSFQKYQIRGGLEYRKMKHHFERREGIANKIHLEQIFTMGVPLNFGKITNTFSFYKFLGKRGNLAVQNKIGIATNRNSPFSPFVIDNYINIRGSGNRVERGTAEFVLNLEYHFTAWKNKYFTLQTTAFSDMGALRDPGANFFNMFRDNSIYRYAGLGIRLNSNFIYKSIIRFDYSFNLKDLRQSGFVVGFGQYF